jgi:hypothetical protein
MEIGVVSTEVALKDQFSAGYGSFVGFSIANIKFTLR